MNHKLMFVAAVFGLALMGASARAVEEKVKPDIAEGIIDSVDAGAHSLVLVDKNESRTTFKVMVKVEGKREPARILLDGKKSSFEDAIRPKRKASVTYVKVAKDDLWVWKVDVSSTAK